jgi:hypothetical protein
VNSPIEPNPGTDFRILHATSFKSAQPDASRTPGATTGGTLRSRLNGGEPPHGAALGNALAPQRREPPHGAGSPTEWLPSPDLSLSLIGQTLGNAKSSWIRWARGLTTGLLVPGIISI